MAIEEIISDEQYLVLNTCLSINLLSLNLDLYYYYPYKEKMVLIFNPYDCLNKRGDKSNLSNVRGLWGTSGIKVLLYYTLKLSICLYFNFLLQCYRLFIVTTIFKFKVARFQMISLHMALVTAIYWAGKSICLWNVCGSIMVR